MRAHHRVGALAPAASSPKGPQAPALHSVLVSTLKADDTRGGRALAPLLAGACRLPAGGRRPAWPEAGARWAGDLEGSPLLRPPPPKSEVSAMQLLLEPIGEPCSPKERRHCGRACLLRPNGALAPSCPALCSRFRGSLPCRPSPRTLRPLRLCRRSRGRGRPGPTDGQTPCPAVSLDRRTDTRPAWASGLTSYGDAGKGRRRSTRPRG